MPKSEKISFSKKYLEANGYFCIQKANEEVAILGQRVCVIPSAFFHQITLT